MFASLRRRRRRMQIEILTFFIIFSLIKWHFHGIAFASVRIVRIGWPLVSLISISDIVPIILQIDDFHVIWRSLVFAGNVSSVGELLTNWYVIQGVYTLRFVLEWNARKSHQ